MNQLEQLKKMTTVVADTGDIESVKKYHPTDATTNPSLILKAAKVAQYQPLIDDAIEYAKKKGSGEKDTARLLMQRLFVNFGLEILKEVPGRVSTEVDARLSFDVEGSLEFARAFIKMYEDAGISRERILIKLASTWEGIQACKILEKEGIHCNMTLMFSIAQAVASAEAKATLVSPFVGRILDWYKKSEGVEGYPAEKDPGVISVREIFTYFKKYGHHTEIMGASFRNKEEVLALAGCDFLTISPDLLEEIYSSDAPLKRALNEDTAKSADVARLTFDEKGFRWAMNQDAMATEKLAEGIRGFARDAHTLESQILKRF